MSQFPSPNGSELGKRVATTDKSSRKRQKSSPTPRTVHDVQTAIQNFRVVSEEQLRQLQMQGYTKTTALHQLLQRIRRSNTADQSDLIPRLVQSGSFHAEGAIRVSVLKQELFELRQQGHDTISAIGVLTQRLCSLKRTLDDDSNETSLEKRQKLQTTTPPPTTTSHNTLKRTLSDSNELPAKKAKANDDLFISMALVTEENSGQI